MNCAVLLLSIANARGTVGKAFFGLTTADFAFACAGHGFQLARVKTPAGGNAQSVADRCFAGHNYPSIS